MTAIIQDQGIEGIIEKAMAKLNVSSLQELARYLPREDGYAIHHTVVGRLRNHHPEELKELIQKHILDNSAPSMKPKGSSPHPVPSLVSVQLKRSQLNKLVEALKDSDNQDIQDVMNILVPYQSFSHVQKLMIQMIREKKADQGLWEAYSDMIRQADEAKGKSK